MPKVVLRPQEDWALIIPRSAQLPLPSEVRWGGNIPGIRLRVGETYQVIPGDYLVTATKKNKRQYWGFNYIMYAVHPEEDKLVRVPYGILHKTVIKHAEGTKDIMPGAGPLAAIIREVHAIRRGIIRLGFESRPSYLTRYQRPWVI